MLWRYDRTNSYVMVIPPRRHGLGWCGRGFDAVLLDGPRWSPARRQRRRVGLSPRIRRSEGALRCSGKGLAPCRRPVMNPGRWLGRPLLLSPRQGGLDTCWPPGTTAPRLQRELTHRLSPRACIAAGAVRLRSLATGSCASCPWPKHQPGLSVSDRPWEKDRVDPRKMCDDVVAGRRFPRILSKMPRGRERRAVGRAVCAWAEGRRGGDCPTERSLPSHSSARRDVGRTCVAP